MNELQKSVEVSNAERALMLGDLSRLTLEERSNLYLKVCETLGLNPYTQPFSYLQLNGKLVLYAQRNCTDQLRALRNVSIIIASRDKVGGDLYIVNARAKLPNGRTDESTGAVTIGNLKGDALANALMKAETKAKRRVTLSICGLSYLDETEVETIRDAKIVEAPILNPPEVKQAVPPPPAARDINKVDSELSAVADKYEEIEKDPPPLPPHAGSTWTPSKGQHKLVYDTAKKNKWSVDAINAHVKKNFSKTVMTVNRLEFDQVLNYFMNTRCTEEIVQNLRDFETKPGAIMERFNQELAKKNEYVDHTAAPQTNYEEQVPF